MQPSLFFSFSLDGPLFTYLASTMKNTHLMAFRRSLMTKLGRFDEPLDILVHQYQTIIEGRESGTEHFYAGCARVVFSHKPSQKFGPQLYIILVESHHGAISEFIIHLPSRANLRWHQDFSVVRKSQKSTGIRMAENSNFPARATSVTLTHVTRIPDARSASSP